MKKLVTVALFIFWAVATAILTAGLVFYQNNKSQNTSSINSNVNNLINSSTGQITLSLTEIAKHNSRNDCWLMIDNKIYSLASYMDAHPGGVNAILPLCGQDGTAAYNSKGGSGHSAYAHSLLASYYVGDVNQTIGANQVNQNIQNANNVTPPVGRGEQEDD